jgi:DNA-binding NarL/FixJ family response regulator
MGISVTIIDNQHFFAEGIKELARKIDTSILFVEPEIGRSQKGLFPPANVNVVIFDPASVDKLSEMLNDIRNTANRISVLVVASHFDLAVASICLQQGVSGFMLKSDPIQELELALRKVFAGSVYFCQEVQEHQIRTLHLNLAGANQLTAREREVMNLLLHDMSPKEIAVHIGVSRKTVDTHKRNLFEKIGVCSMTQFILYGIRTGLVKA